MLGPWRRGGVAHRYVDFNDAAAHSCYREPTVSDDDDHPSCDHSASYDQYLVLEYEHYIHDPSGNDHDNAGRLHDHRPCDHDIDHRFGNSERSHGDL